MVPSGWLGLVLEGVKKYWRLSTYTDFKRGQSSGTGTGRVVGHGVSVTSRCTQQYLGWVAHAWYVNV